MLFREIIAINFKKSSVTEIHCVGTVDSYRGVCQEASGRPVVHLNILGALPVSADGLRLSFLQI